MVGPRIVSCLVLTGTYQYISRVVNLGVIQVYCPVHSGGTSAPISLLERHILRQGRHRLE